MTVFMYGVNSFQSESELKQVDLLAQDSIMLLHATSVNVGHTVLTSL